MLLAHIESLHELIREHNRLSHTRMGLIEDKQAEQDTSTKRLLGAVESIDNRLRSGDQRMSEMQADQQLVQGELAANTEVTSEVRDLLVTIRTGAKAMSILGSVITWTIKAVGAIAVAVGSIWGAYQVISGGATFPPKH